MNATKKLYVILCLISIVFFTLKIITINSFPYMVNYFDCIVFFILFISFYFLYGLRRSKNYLENISIRYIIILLLSYILVIYMLGFFMGFSKSVYSLNLISIIKNIWPIFFTIIFKELIRYIISFKAVKNIGPYILLTVIYILIDLFNVYYASSFTNSYLIFNFICLNVLPTIAKEAVSSYITYNINYIPTLIYNLAFGIVPFLLPIVPNLGNYINSILGILFPFMMFLLLRKVIKYHDKDIVKLRPIFVKLICFPIIIFTAILIVLVSGIFSYKLIAIGSDSMNPIYYKGDAVIYEKVKPEDIVEGDILVFNHNNEVITHRVKSIIIKGNAISFVTKGDNNNTIDSKQVSEEEVLGKVKYIVKYVGYPTILLNDFFKE